jgi:protein-S-isoprenylcysteine O-methyltransferase Ste14
VKWLEHRIPPPVVGLIVAASMWSASSLGPHLAIPSGARIAIVVLLVTIGIGFDVLGLLAFRSARTTVNPFRPEKASTLVTNGVYRVTRNPMYVGMAFLLLAWAVYLGAFVPFAGIVLFVLYITRFQIRPEERVLAGIFGEGFSNYVARVRRWL